MKLANKTLTWFIAGVVSLSLVASAEAQSAKQRTGKVVRIKGAARYSTGNKVWQPLKVGTILKSGAIIQTAQDSYADVVLNEASSAPAAPPAASSKISSSAPSAKPPSPTASATRAVDQDVVRVMEDSVLSFDRLSAVDTGADRVTETELDLRTGAIFCAVKKQAAASRFEIKIPNGVAGIRGTYVYIDANSGTFSCFSGSLVGGFKNTSGPTPAADAKVVEAGFQFNVQSGDVTPIAAAAMGQLEILVNDFGGIFAQKSTPAQPLRAIDQTVYLVSGSK